MANLPDRKSPRLPGYDYSRNGAYFITICTEGRRLVFGGSVGADSISARMADQIWRRTLAAYPVEQCCYGHLHGYAIRRRLEEERNGTTFSLISADYLGFVPKKICE